MSATDDDGDKTILYRNRATGAIETERVFGGGALGFLYGTRRGRALTELLLRRPFMNHVYGWIQRAGRSRRRIPEFVRSLGIDASEAERPLEDYRSLDDFFTRRLRPLARPVEPSAERLVAPGDGRALVVPRLGDEGLAVKESRVGLEELLGDGSLARRYEGGAALVLRLAPADYHRFHFPDGGAAGPSRRLGRRLHSVHPIALAAGAPSLANKRMVSVLESDGFGPLALVEVGALCVGTIVQTYREGRVERGAEKGYFRFGGSTVLVLAEPGALRFDGDLVETSARGLETLVKMGTGIASRAGAPAA